MPSRCSELRGQLNGPASQAEVEDADVVRTVEESTSRAHATAMPRVSNDYYAFVANPLNLKGRALALSATGMIQSAMNRNARCGRVFQRSFDSCMRAWRMA